MKDNQGIELVKGDLCILVIDTPIENPSELIIFLEAEPYTYKVLKDGTEISKTTDTVKYYPLTDLGEEVARFDSGITQEPLHREQKFVVTHIKPKHLNKISSTGLIGNKKKVYDVITALL